jgi:hypothetical protein
MGKANMRRFADCSMYHACAVYGTIRNTDFRDLEIWEGPYAQYRTAVHIRGKRPRERKSYGYTLTPDTGYYVVIVPGAYADRIDAIGLSMEKILSGFPGTPWLREVEQAVIATKVPILARYCYEDPRDAVAALQIEEMAT